MFWGLVAAVCLSAAVGAADPPKLPGARCSKGQSNASSEIACELAAELAELPRPALVVAGKLDSDTKTRDAAGIVRLLGRVVAGALGEGIRVSDGPAGLAQARSRAARTGALVYLRPALRRGQLEVTADVYPAVGGFWARVRDPEPSPMMHAFSSRGLDPELRTFLPPVPLVAQHVERAALTTGEPVALACADVDGDNASELLVVDRRRITSARVRKRRVVALATAQWADLGSVAPSPLRQPIAGVMAVSDRWVVGLTDRAESIQLDAALQVTGREPRAIPWAPAGCVDVQAWYLHGQVRPCFGDGTLTKPGVFDDHLDAVAGARIVTRRGRPRVTRVGRTSDRDTAMLVDDDGRKTTLGGVGAGLAVGDLDGDGQPEILSSAPTLDPTADVLHVRTWLEDGSVVDRYTLPVPDGIRALAICPAESAGIRPVVVATATELWVVR